MEQLDELATDLEALAQRLEDDDPEQLADVRARALADRAPLIAALVGSRITALENALAELAGFVTAELDPDPGPWAGYVTSDDARLVLLELEARTIRNAHRRAELERQLAGKGTACS